MLNSQVMHNLQIIILAAGKGSRMKSEIPKAMHKIAGKSMLDIVIDHATQMTKDITIVYSDLLKPYLYSSQELGIQEKSYNGCKLVKQPEPLGTGHAVYCALDSIDESKPTIILYADNPLIDDKLMGDMLRSFIENKSDIMVMAFERKNPEGYGRLVLDDKKYVQKIIESKDANDEEKAITLCNSGIMIFNSKMLKLLLAQLVNFHNDVNEEYYLTTIVEMGYNDGYKTSYYTSSDNLSLGVNTQEELRLAESLFALQKK